MKQRKQLAKKLNKRFAEKQDELDRRPAVMGDGAGNLYVTGFDNFVYVTMGDKAVPVFNNRVPPQTGLQVWVGYAAEEPTLFQVLATRSESPAGVQTGFVGYAPARRYEWMARNGGQDPLSVHLRAFTPLKLSVSPDGWMFVDLYRGFIYSGSAYIAVPRQNVDLYAQIPTTTGKAAFVLITINTSGAVVQTKGSEVDIDVLAITDIPAIPAGTSFICGAVRVYYGQLEIQEGRTNTDFVDLRFPGYAGGGLWQPLDADLTAIAGLSPANDDIIQRKAGAWTNRTLAQYKTDIHLENINVDTILTDTKDPTGWVDPTNVNVSYDSTARTITLTPVSGTLQYYWRGVKVDLGATWTSSAHDAADGGYYLYSTDGTNITWSTTAWTFDMLMVAKAIVSTSPAYKFAIKETHGLMPWEAHQELHDAISTYRTSGGTLTAGTYTENTATDAANTPGFDAAVIKDEDDSVTIPAWAEGTYTTLRIGASSKATFDTTATLPFRSSGSYILVNNPTTGAETASTNNKYVNVYQVLIPAAIDATSQSYRMVMMQPQRDHPTLADAQLENPQNLSFGDLTSTTPEFVIYARITYVLSAGDGNTGKARIATGGISYITGSRLAQTSSSGISNHEDLSGLLGGATDDHYHLTNTEYVGTGTGVFVHENSPTFITPNLGTPTALVLTNATGLPLTTGVTGILSAANGGTGVNNSTRTLTISTNAGTISFSAAASTLTVPATGTAALLATANNFSAAQTISNTTESSGNGTGALIVSGGASIAKLLYVGTDGANAQMYFTGGAGFVRDLIFATDRTPRWILRANNTAEGGSNTGSDLQLFSRTDAGGALTSVFSVTRSSGLFNFSVTTDSTSSTTGAVIFGGGVGIAKALYVGTDFAVNGNTTLGNASTDTITHTGRAIFRTAASDPKHATAGSRPAGSVGEIVYYTGKMYFCTNAATPLWELITSA